MSLCPRREHALIRVDISLTSSLVLKNFRMYKFPNMSSTLLCWARRIITAVTNFDISSSLRSSSDLSY